MSLYVLRVAEGGAADLDGRIKVCVYIYMYVYMCVCVCMCGYEYVFYTFYLHPKIFYNNINKN